MKLNMLLPRSAKLCFVFIFCLGNLFGQASSLGITIQNGFFPTQFNSGGGFFNNGSVELGMWANTNAKQTVAWRDLKTTSDNSGTATRSLQIGDEFSITVNCTRAFGQIGFSLNASGTQGGSYVNNISGSKLRINTDNFGSWYISNGSSAASFNYSPSQDIFRDYTFKVKILSPTLITASLFVNGGFHSDVKNFNLLNANPITSFSIYGSDMWDGNSNENAYWKSCSVSSTTTVELGYALAAGGNLTPGSISDGLTANSNSTSVVNAVFIGGNTGSSVIYNSGCTYTGLTTINTNATLRISSNQSLTNLTINSGGTVIVDPNIQLTLTGNIVNNGTLTIENGATLVQTGSGSNSGTGTYNVKQTITGSGGATPNGRVWYLGSPLSNGSSTALLSSTGNQLWQWDETNANYSLMVSGQALAQGKSYVLRSGQTSETINFSGSGLSNGALGLLNLTRTGTTAQFRGCHLVNNPYPSYLDWDMVGKTNVSTTMYVRTALGSNFNVLETYNSFDQIGTSISGTPMTKYIAPMQGFWVKVIADGQTGSLALDNSMRSHQSNGAGLRSSAQDFPAFLRFNMLDGESKDQVILIMSPDASTSLDEHDSEKMIATGSAQFYSTVNAKKLVINGMKNIKAKTSVPLTLDLPLSKSYIFQAEEMNIEDGLILLEDKQEGVLQDLTINPVYSFFGNAGINSSRFVIHFQLANSPVLGGGPADLEILGTHEFTTENIHIVSNNQGLIVVRLEEGFKPDGIINIFEASGRLVEQRSFKDQEERFNLKEQNGIYFVEVNYGKVISKKKVVILH